MTFNEYFLYFIQWVNHSKTCIALPIITQGCDKFWIACYSLAVCICVALLLYALRNILRDKADFKAYQKHKLERAMVADSQTMEKALWQTDNSFDKVEQSVLAEKMRQELKKNKPSM